MDVHIFRNINYPKNMIFLPYETAGACHLGVQLHRGDHRVVDSEGRNYHDLVADTLNLAQSKINKCDNTPDSTLVALIKVMNRISAIMVKNMKFIGNNKPDIYLSSVSGNFINGNPVGCANANSIPTMRINMVARRKYRCANRDHQYSVSKQETKRGYKITYPKQNYQLKEGL